MKRRWILVWTCAALLMAVSAQAETQTWLGFQIGIGSAPPQDFGWRHEPHQVLVRDVYVVTEPDCDDDVFRYGGGWYRLHGGYWYAGNYWRGPWRAVDVRRVPNEVLYVPADHWRHHPHGGPRGQLKRAWREDRRHDRRQDRRHREEGHRDRENDRERGHGDEHRDHR